MDQKKYAKSMTGLSGVCDPDANGKVSERHTEKSAGSVKNRRRW